MSGCGAAAEAKYWGKDLKVIMVDKAATERSGATGEGLSAINRYMGMKGAGTSRRTMWRTSATT